jgi:hypothetical protein
MKKKLALLLLALAALLGAQTVPQAEAAICPLKCCIDGSACAHCCPGKPCNLFCG